MATEQAPQFDILLAAAQMNPSSERDVVIRELSPTLSKKRTRTTSIQTENSNGDAAVRCDNSTALEGKSAVSVSDPACQTAPVVAAAGVQPAKKGEVLSPRTVLDAQNVFGGENGSQQPQSQTQPITEGQTQRD
eukprot:Opistho-2@9000